MQLEEKCIPYEIEKINMSSYGEKDPSYLQKVPSGLIPAMELDGEVITESVKIAEILEHEFSDNPLLPTGTSDKKHADLVEK